MFLALCPLLLIAQAPDTAWTKTFGGMYQDYGNSVQQTVNGDFVIVGYTDDWFNKDIYVIRTDADGVTLWTETYGAGDYDVGTYIQETADDGLIMTGYAVLFSSYDVYLLRTDKYGDSLWAQAYGGTENDLGWSVQQTSDGGYIIVGTTLSFGAGAGDVYLIKTDSLGDTTWTRTYGGVSSDGGFSVQATTDNGYIIVGYTQSFGSGGRDVYLIKTDADGDTLWTKTHGGTDDDQGFSVQQTSDGGYVIGGWISTYADSDNVWLLKTDALGDTLWTRNFGGIVNERGYSVKQTSDNGYIIAGIKGPWIYSDVYIIRTDSLGATLWTKTYGGAYDDAAFSVQQTIDGGYIIAGYTSSFGVDPDVWLLKMEPDVFIEENNTVIKKTEYSATIISGPLLLPKGKTCRVFDITGRAVAPGNIRPGIYFIEIDKKIVQKVVKVR